MKCDMPYPEIFSHKENELIDCLLIESVRVNNIRVLNLTCIFLVLFFPTSSNPVQQFTKQNGKKRQWWFRIG